MFDFTDATVETTTKTTGTRAKRTHIKAFASPMQAALCGLKSLVCGDVILTGSDLEWTVRQGLYHRQSREGVIAYGSFYLSSDDEQLWIPNQEYSPAFCSSQLPLVASGQPVQGFKLAPAQLTEFDLWNTNDKERKSAETLFRAQVINPLNTKARAFDAELKCEFITYTHSEGGFITIYKREARKTKGSAE